MKGINGLLGTMAALAIAESGLPTTTPLFPNQPNPLFKSDPERVKRILEEAQKKRDARNARVVAQMEKGAKK